MSSCSLLKKTKVLKTYTISELLLERLKSNNEIELHVSATSLALLAKPMKG
jgi:hypothetical protein